MATLKWTLLCNIIIVLSICTKTVAQDANFKVAPFATTNTSIKDGQLEIGPEFIFNKDSVDIGGFTVSTDGGNSFIIRPTFRIPLTNKENNVVQIDRYTSTWRSILALQYTLFKIGNKGLINTHSFVGQFEYGFAQFKYYPTGEKSKENKQQENSFGGEFKYIGFFTQGKLGTKQFSPQIRLRYSYDWKAGKEVGVVNSPNYNGVTTTTNMIVDAPSVQPTISVAFTFQFYSGRGCFSYSPALYYDITSRKGQSSTFNSLNRLRLEFWTFYYPLIKDNANVKIGVSPFMSIRTKGTDDFNQIEYGGMITIRFNSTFLHFF
ncbi:MAG: hypothetical protein ABR519_11535 [Bacteroidales bacterium]